jgi:ankyrin repeat protein
VSQLLSAGADPNKANSTGSNPLLEAALLCKDAILDLLLQAGKMNI